MTLAVFIDRLPYCAYDFVSSDHGDTVYLLLWGIPVITHCPLTSFSFIYIVFIFIVPSAQIQTLS